MKMTCQNRWLNPYKNWQRRKKKTTLLAARKAKDKEVRGRIRERH